MKYSLWGIILPIIKSKLSLARSGNNKHAVTQLKLYYVLTESVISVTAPRVTAVTQKLQQKRYYDERK